MWRRLPAIVAAMGAGLACPTDPETQLIPTVPLWMEWPAEARANAAFNTRLVGYQPGCYPRQDLAVTVDRFTAEVIFRTVWFVEGSPDALCDPGYYDTLVTVAGLPATTDSVYGVYALQTDSRTLLRMGAILARPAAALSDRTSGAGIAVGATDIEGCAIMQRPFDVPVPIENPPSATWNGFVRGYFFTPAAPLCGQVRAFHLEEIVAPVVPR